MEQITRWITENDSPDSIEKTHLAKWAFFDDYINERMLDHSHFVWRGQADESWLLEPTLDRLLKRLNKLHDMDIRQHHLNRFKYSTRGRRGMNPPLLQNENDWWALGQHNGLATPLLDWTTSPYVAAYFAFAGENNKRGTRRAIFGISKLGFQRKSQEIVNSWEGETRAAIVEFIEPLTDENPRLVSQGGLFTRAPDGVDIESWVKQNFEGETTKIRYMKLTIPNEDRNVCLRSLNRMNINHLSLFPDLYGASKFTNLDLLIDNY